MANENTKSVESVSLNKSTLTIKVKSTEQLTAIFSPTDATDQKVTWSSSNKDVATVDANGHVAGVKRGNATITVTTEDGNKTATCTVTVKDVLQLYQSDIIVKKSDTFQLTALYIGTKKLTWSSSNKDVATVDIKGTVTGVEEGEATITVQIENQDETDTCTVKVVSETSEDQSTWIDKYVPLYDKEQNGYILAIDLKDKNNVDFTGQILTQGNLENFGGSIFISETETLSCLLTSVSFHKEVFQPGQLELVIDTNGKLSNFGECATLGYVEKKSTDDSTTSNSYIVAQKYYIFEKKKKGRYVTLKAYSVDKFLTIDKFNQAFTGKKFVDDMVESTIKTYMNTTNIGKFHTLIDKDNSNESSIIVKNLHHISYISSENTEEEPLMPYSVQYEESFYDFLVRMCNRNGEFLYCEDNKLHIGVPQPDNFNAIPIISEYDNGVANGIEIEYNESGWNYLDQSQTLATNSLEKGAWSEKVYAWDDTGKNMLNTAEKEGLISSEVVYPKEYFTQIKYNDGKPVVITDYIHPIADSLSIIKHVAEEKNFIDAVSSALIEEALLKGVVSSKFMNDANENYKTTYFSNLEADYYQFASEPLLLTENFYSHILAKEKQVEQGKLIVNCPTCREFKLGDIVMVDSSYYVVYQIKGGVLIVDDNEDNSYYKERFELVLLPVEKNDTSSTFKAYPLPMLERRIRKANPQRAKVTDKYDPEMLGRVRVSYPWQSDDGNTTPWLRVVYPMASDDAGLMFIPAIDDEVLIDYEDGNIERPFVSGSFYSTENQPAYHANMHMQDACKSIASANGHHISFTDIDGGGQFLTNLIPVLSFVGKLGIANDWLSFDSEYLDAKNLAGGFEIADYLGLYSISGSTHERNITISSPVGDIVLDAFEGITINAPLGDVNIVGKNVTIEARNNLTMTSGTNIANPRFWTRGLQTKEEYWLDRGVAVASSLSNLFGFNLSTYRTWFEVLLRPIGGTMLLKSHRFMSIEAGEGGADFYSTKYRGDNTKLKLKNFGKRFINSALESDDYDFNLTCPGELRTIQTFIDASVAAYKKFNTCVDLLNQLKNFICNAKDYTLVVVPNQQENNFGELVVEDSRYGNNLNLLQEELRSAAGDNKPNERQPLANEVWSKIKSIKDTIDSIQDIIRLCDNGGVLTIDKTHINGAITTIKEWLRNITINEERIAVAENLNIPEKKTKLVVQTDVYPKIKTFVEAGGNLKNYITLGNLNPNYDENLLEYNVSEIEHKEHKLLDNIAEILGWKGAYDDHSWSKRDKGTILFSSEKDKAYRIDSNGEIVESKITTFDPAVKFKAMMDGIEV